MALGFFQITGMRMRQEHLTAPLPKRQTLTLGHGHNLVVFALGHLRTNGSVSQLIGWHDQDLQKRTSKKNRSREHERTKQRG